MKLKKIIASVLSAAIAVSGMVFTPLLQSSAAGATVVTMSGLPKTTSGGWGHISSISVSDLASFTDDASVEVVYSVAPSTYCSSSEQKCFQQCVKFYWTDGQDPGQNSTGVTFGRNFQVGNYGTEVSNTDITYITSLGTLRADNTIAGATALNMQAGQHAVTVKSVRVLECLGGHSWKEITPTFHECAECYIDNAAHDLYTSNCSDCGGKKLATGLTLMSGSITIGWNEDNQISTDVLDTFEGNGYFVVNFASNGTNNYPGIKLGTAVTSYKDITGLGYVNGVAGKASSLDTYSVTKDADTLLEIYVSSTVLETLKAKPISVQGDGLTVSSVKWVGCTKTTHAYTGTNAKTATKHTCDLCGTAGNHDFDTTTFKCKTCTYECQHNTANAAGKTNVSNGDGTHKCVTCGKSETCNEGSNGLCTVCGADLRCDHADSTLKDCVYHTCDSTDGCGGDFTHSFTSSGAALTECFYCGVAKTALPHVFAKTDDDTHTCSTTDCNVVANHAFDGDTDITCNGCGYIRACPAHVWNNMGSNEKCSTCGETRNHSWTATETDHTCECGATAAHNGSPCSVCGYQKIATMNTIWKGSQNLNWDGGKFLIPAAQFKNAKAGSIVEFTATFGSEATYANYQFPKPPENDGTNFLNPTRIAKNTIENTTTLTQWNCYDLYLADDDGNPADVFDNNQTKLFMVISAADLALIQKDGLLVCGFNLTVTEVKGDWELGGSTETPGGNDQSGGGSIGAPGGSTIDSSSSSSSSTATASDTPEIKTVMSAAEEKAFVDGFAKLAESSDAKTVTKTVKNVKQITKDTFAELAKIAKETGKTIKVKADILNEDGSVYSRVVVDASKVKKDLNLEISTDNKQATEITEKFSEKFSNDLFTINTKISGNSKGYGTWGTEVEMIIKPKFEVKSAKKLVAYAYNEKTGKYTRIKDAVIKMDKNGYLHLTTKYAGDIIISNGKFKK